MNLRAGAGSRIPITVCEGGGEGRGGGRYGAYSTRQRTLEPEGLGRVAAAKRSRGLQTGDSAGLNDWSAKCHAVSFIYSFIYLFIGPPLPPSSVITFNDKVREQIINSDRRRTAWEREERRGDLRRAGGSPYLSRQSPHKEGV